MSPKRFKLTPYPVDHHLKCHPESFSAIWAGEKTHEIRFNDRRYKVPQTIRLKEFNPDSRQYSGRAIDIIIIHLRHAQGEGIPFSVGLLAGHVVFDFAILNQFGQDGQSDDFLHAPTNLPLQKEGI